MGRRSNRNGWLAVIIGAVLCSAIPDAGDAWARQNPATAGKARTIGWDDLIPKGWDPLQHFRHRDIATIREGSSEELALMRELREIWDNAPTRGELDGARIRLPGYVVPLDIARGGRLSEFLLVPYFGACIHTPPPPANQIIHVTLKSPANWRAMDAVWVSGVLSTTRLDSSMGMSGYAMIADKVEAYREPAR